MRLQLEFGALLGMFLDLEHPFKKRKAWHIGNALRRKAGYLLEATIIDAATLEAATALY